MKYAQIYKIDFKSKINIINFEKSIISAHKDCYRE